MTRSGTRRSSAHLDVKKLKWKEAFQQVSADLLQLESEAAAKGPRNPYGLPPPRGGAGGAEKDEEQELEAHNARCLAHAQKALPEFTQLCNLLAAAQTLEQAPEDAFDSGLCGTLRGLLQRHQGYKTQLELRKAPLRQEQELEEDPASLPKESCSGAEGRAPGLAKRQGKGSRTVAAGEPGNWGGARHGPGEASAPEGCRLDGAEEACRRLVEGPSLQKEGRSVAWICPARPPKVT